MVSLPTLKSHYRSGVDVLATGFFSPCIREASLYRRAAGYFSSHALATWADALPHVVTNGTPIIKLIASPELSPTDKKVFQEIVSDAKRAEYRSVVVDRVLEEIIALTEQPNLEGARARVLAWLVANERLEVRFAFPTHVEESGLFHEKIGVFDLPGGNQVAFTGSANETLGGHRVNYESIDVYRSWISGEEERVQTKVEQFEEAWNGYASGLEVEAPTPEVVERLISRAPRKLPTRQASSIEKKHNEDHRWRHQEKALAIFVNETAGVLEMATGTGKTRTTLKILNQLIPNGAIESAIVATDGIDLLDQWRIELDAWVLETGHPWLILSHFHRNKELGEFALNPNKAILVISREQLHRVLQRIPPNRRKRMIIVHDEVHGLGSPGHISSLSGEHEMFGWRLGLSATPEREYDEAGNKFIAEEIGSTIYQFPLEKAIRRGVLSGFDYQVLDYELTASDRGRLAKVFKKEAARKREGIPMSKEEVWRDLAAVYKTAEMKPDVFYQFLQRRPHILENCIIFVETQEYGNALLNKLHRFTSRYRTYFAKDDRDHLVQFASGEIDCLITCHRISQGIDIKSLRTVVLFSSARSRLETIQRIGRCLRIDPENPDKRALVIDFVRPANRHDQMPSADQERCKWLTSLSRIRRETNA